MNDVKMWVSEMRQNYVANIFRRATNQVSIKLDKN